MLRTGAGARVALGGMAAVVSVLAAGCGGGSPAAAGRTGHAAAGSTPVPVTRVPKYVASKNARTAVAATGCKQDGAHGWLARGTVTNSASSARGYSIVVDFVTAKGDTVLDTRIVKVPPVPPKSSAQWSVLGAPGSARVSCVIRQALIQS
jgi:hypothetical protein